METTIPGRVSAPSCLRTYSAMASAAYCDCSGLAWTEAGDADNLYVIDAEGGIPRRLTPETSDEHRPFWPRDGRWIYFGSK